MVANGKKKWAVTTYKKKSRALGTAPVMMNRLVAFKRQNQVFNRVFWFKFNGTIGSDLGGNVYQSFNTRAVNLAGTIPPGFDALKQLYDQYKILAIRLKLFPANVGIEPDTTLFAQGGLIRGDTAIWSDQRFDFAQQGPTQISQVINVASCKMINSRRPYSRTLYRAKGYPGWANTQGPGTADSWNGSIEMIVNNATPQQAGGASPLLWYYTLQYKVMVRGRTQG